MAELNILQQLCIKLVERADHLKLTRKRADDEAVSFLAGAAIALALAGKEKDAQFVGQTLAMVISVRGMFEVRHIASQAQEKKDA